MTSKEIALRCRKCSAAVPDGNQMLCMGVKPIALIDDVADADCPKHQETPAVEMPKQHRCGRPRKVAAPPAVDEKPQELAADPDEKLQGGENLEKSELTTETVDEIFFNEENNDENGLEPVTEKPEPVEAAADPVHHPNHYSWRGGLECIEIARELCQESDGIAAYLIGCATKYIYRYPAKNGLQDLDKAIECLTMLRNIEARKGGKANAR